MDTTAEEINELLMESGQVAVGELCKRFNLPADFLQESIEKRVGTIIQGQLDPNSSGSLFTDAFVARQVCARLCVGTPRHRHHSAFGFGTSLFFLTSFFFLRLETPFLAHRGCSSS